MPGHPDLDPEHAHQMSLAHRRVIGHRRDGVVSAGIGAVGGLVGAWKTGSSSANAHTIATVAPLDAPDLPRAFIPYAHVQNGIRDELTTRTLAVIDALRSSYKREVLRQAKYCGLDHAV